MVVSTTCLTDIDKDHPIDGTDLARLAFDYNRTDCSVASPCSGDVKGDEIVNAVDLNIFASEFGKTMCPHDEFYYFHNNHLGTPQRITDQTGTVVWSANFKPFGEAFITTNIISNLFRFPGQYYDQETGLHYNYHRSYGPQTERYLTPDPLGIDAWINLFSYVKNNPLKWCDPLGFKDDSLYRSYGGGFSLSLIWSVSTGVKTYECCDQYQKRHIMTVVYFCCGMDIGLSVKIGGNSAISDKKKRGRCPKLDSTNSWYSSHGSAVYGALPFYGRSYDIHEDEGGTIFGLGGGYRLWMECHNHVEQDTISGCCGQ